jgi:hypothetical protein
MQPELLRASRREVSGLHGWDAARRVLFLQESKNLADHELLNEWAFASATGQRFAIQKPLAIKEEFRF